MKYVAFDTETQLIEQYDRAKACDVPPFIVMSWCDEDLKPQLDSDHRACSERFKRWLLDPNVSLVGHNVVFDLKVMLRLVWETLGEDLTPQVFDALDNGRVYDTAIRAQLNDIASGGLKKAGYQMHTLVKKHLNLDISEDKKGAHAWRMRYDELSPYPVSVWPREAVDYALDDSLYTYQLFERIERHPNERFQVAGAFALGLTQARGFAIDYEWAEHIADFYACVEAEATETLVRCGIVVDGVRKRDKVEALFREAWESIDEEPWLTDGGAEQLAKGAPRSGCSISTAKDVLDYLEQRGATDKRLDLAAGVEGPFAALVRLNRAQKYLSGYLAPILACGSRGRPLVTSYSVLVDTGRTSSRGPNVQNFPARARPDEKKLEVQGPMIRGCFIPRPGHVLVDADYTAIEMVALAQVCISIGAPYRDLADAINDGLDLHVKVAACALDMTYDECLAHYKRYKDGAKDAVAQLVSEWRQIAKIANYSFPTGASARTFCDMARAQGVDVSMAQAEAVRAAWFAAWRELDFWFANIAGLERSWGGYEVEHHGPATKGGGVVTSGWRRRVTRKYTEAANTRFQGLTADLAKYAGYLLCRACYADADHPLYGKAFPWVFVHDEWGMEVEADSGLLDVHPDYAHFDPNDKEESKKRLTHAEHHLKMIMEKAARTFIPDIVVIAEPGINRTRWSK